MLQGKLLYTPRADVGADETSIERPHLNRPAAAVDSADAKASTLRGRDMLCFSHDWGGDPLSKTHLVRLMARHNRVLWVNSIGYRTPSLTSGYDVRRAFKKLTAMTTPIQEVEKNIFVLNPLAVPLYGPLGRALSARLLQFQLTRAMRKLDFERVINWVFNPAAAIIAGKLGEAQVVYYCVDEFSRFRGVPAQRLQKLEEKLLQRADAVILSASRLYDAKVKLNPNAALVRHGVDYLHFRRALDPATAIPSELVGLPKPILGYFGLIAPDWIDLPLLVHVAKSFPHASLVMLGKTTMDVSPLQRLPNVHLLGRKDYGTLPAYAKAFDVALVPFPINEVTLSSNPLKAREYLACGLPVISTRIPEAESLGLCRIGDGPESFVQEIRAALTDPGPSKDRSEAMRNESWEARLKQIERYLASMPSKFMAA
jgi:glycosyltransferase involved in cell wall biosynthesis